MSKQEQAEFLIAAMPYIKKYFNKTLVVKYGGNAMIDEELKSSVMRDLVVLNLLGIKVVLVHGGGPGVDFSEEKAKEILSEDEVIINIDLNSGSSKATAWGCDLTYDYVKINGDYRT